MPVKHAFTSAITDEVVPAGRVQPSNWNADHDLSGMVQADVSDAYAYRSGNLYLPTQTGIQNIGSSTGLFVANALRATPVVFPAPGSFAPFVNVTTSISGGVRAGLYQRRSNGLPGTLIADLGTLSLATNGAITGSTYTKIKAGAYMLVLFISAAATVRLAMIGGPATVASTATPIHNGMDMIEADFTTGAAQGVRYDNTLTYPTGTLPDLSSTGSWTTNTAASSWAVFLKAQ